MLHLDAMTVTGKTLGENLDALQKERFLRALRRAAALKKPAHLSRMAAAHRHHPHVRKRHRAQTAASPFSRATSRPRAAVIKHTACPKEMFQVTLRAKPYDSEEACIAAVLHGDVRPGDAVFIRYEGPRGSGMPEMFYTGEAICADPALASQRRTHHRRALFRRKPRPGHRPRQPRGCCRRADRAGGRGRSDPHRCSRPRAGNRRREGRGKNAWRDRRHSCRAPRALAGKAAQIQKRPAQALYRACREPHEGRLYGMILTDKKWDVPRGTSHFFIIFSAFPAR